MPDYIGGDAWNAQPTGGSSSGSGMDWGAMAPALINIGGGLLGNLFNASSQSNANQAQRDWAREMYDIQRRDALTDREFQNNYNSPAAQMARLKAAGLNPNLVYGSGNATQGSAAVRSSDPGSYQPKAPQIDTANMGSALMMMYNVMKTQAETDNIRAATDLAKQNTIVAQTQADKNRQDITRSSTMLPADLQREQAITKKTYADTVRTIAETDKIPYEVAKLKADTKFTLAQNIRNAEMNDAQVSKILLEKIAIQWGYAKTDAEIRHIDQMIINMQKDLDIKTFEDTYREKGIQPGDPAWQRALQKLWYNLKEGGKSFIDPSGKWFK